MLCTYQLLSSTVGHQMITTTLFLSPRRGGRRAPTDQSIGVSRRDRPIEARAPDRPAQVRDRAGKRLPSLAVTRDLRIRTESQKQGGKWR